MVFAIFRTYHSTDKRCYGFIQLENDSSYAGTLVKRQTIINNKKNNNVNPDRSIDFFVIGPILSFKTSLFFCKYFTFYFTLGIFILRKEATITRFFNLLQCSSGEAGGSIFEYYVGWPQ